MAFSDIAATALPVIGGVVGSAVPGLGTAAGSAIGSVLGGIAQTSSANRKEKDYRAKDAAIPLYDPMQMSYLDKVQRMQRSFQAGADPMTAYQTRLAREGQANVLANLNRAGGGSSANIQNSMARTLAPTANAIQGAGAAASRQALSLMDMEGGLIGSIAERVRRRQVEQRDMAMAEYARSRQDANNAMMAGLALLPDVKFGGGGKRMAGAPLPQAPDRSWHSMGIGSPIQPPAPAPMFSVIAGSNQAPVTSMSDIYPGAPANL